MSIPIGGSTNFTYSGGSSVSVDKGARNGVTLTLSPTITRSGNGTLVVIPANGIAALGSSESLKGSVFGATALTNGIVNTSIVGQNNDSNLSGDFLTFTSSNGFKVATYAADTDINTAPLTAVFQANSPQLLTANRSVYAIKNNGQTINLGTKVLQIGDAASGHQAGLVMNGGSISNGTLYFGFGGAPFGGSNEGTIYTSLAGGTISAPILTTGAVTLFGPGILTLSGSSTYSNTTNVNSGGLNLGGRLQSNIVLGSDAILTGSGQTTGSVRGGLISPGNGIGIFAAASTNYYSSIGNSYVPTNYAFEFTQTGLPNFASASNSGNDVLRLTGTSAPFSSALTANNEVDVYFGLGAGVHPSDTFLGGFYTDKSADFSSLIGSANFKYFLSDPSGTVTFNGSAYRPYNDNPILITTIPQAATFSSGTVNGFVMKAEVVPEPGAVGLVTTGAGVFVLLRAWVVRRRKRSC
jgi:autotransporter-associated beta strand protein